MEVTAEPVKCDTPSHMTVDLCKNCLRATSALEEGVEYETFNLTKSLMNGYKCDGYINKENRS